MSNDAIQMLTDLIVVVKEYEANEEAFRSEISRLTQQNSTLEFKMKMLEDCEAEEEKDFNDMCDQLKKSRAKNVTLENEIARLTQQNSALESKLKMLADQIEEDGGYNDMCDQLSYVWDKLNQSRAEKAIAEKAIEHLRHAVERLERLVYGPTGQGNRNKGLVKQAEEGEFDALRTTTSEENVPF